MEARTNHLAGEIWNEKMGMVVSLPFKVSSTDARTSSSPYTHAVVCTDDAHEENGLLTLLRSALQQERGARYVLEGKNELLESKNESLENRNKHLNLKLGNLRVELESAELKYALNCIRTRAPGGTKSPKRILPSASPSAAHVDATRQVDEIFRDNGEGITYTTDAGGKQHKIKRPLNHFMLWSKQRRAEIKEAETTGSASGLPQQEISQKLAKEWKALSQKERDSWSEKSRQAKADHYQKFPNYKFVPGAQKPQRKLAVASSSRTTEMYQTQRKQTTGGLVHPMMMQLIASMAEPSVSEGVKLMGAGALSALPANGESTHPPRKRQRLTEFLLTPTTTSSKASQVISSSNSCMGMKMSTSHGSGST
jgi:hypothetical protein